MAKNKIILDVLYVLVPFIILLLIIFTINMCKSQDQYTNTGIRSGRCRNLDLQVYPDRNIVEQNYRSGRVTENSARPRPPKATGGYYVGPYGAPARSSMNPQVIDFSNLPILG